MTISRSRRTLYAFIFILLIFLLVEAFLVSAQQKRLLTRSAEHEASLQLDLMADASYEAVLKSDYVTIRTFIERWGQTHADYVLVRAVAPNGFVIGEYRRDAPPQARTFTRHKRISLNGDDLLLLELVSSDASSETIARSLRNQLFGGALLFTAILGTVLWRTLRTTAIRPLEQEIELRQHAEEELQQSHDNLESMVMERTAELRTELAERKRIEQALVEREAHIRLLLDSTAEGIYGVDRSGICTFCNPSALRMLGFTREADVLGKNAHDLFHYKFSDGSPYPTEECRIYNVYHTGEGCHAEDEVFWRTDGTAFPVEYWSYPIKGDFGMPLGAVVTFIDITERKRLETQLVQSQKMEAIGTLAGGVAHDFNNILTAIIGYGSILMKKLDDTDPLKTNVTNILDAAQRAARLTQSLLTFSRKQALSPQPVDINAIVRRVEKLLVRIIGEDVQIVLDLTDEDLITLADSGQLEQVLMNLASNARDAMPNGGTFTVRSERRHFLDTDARLHELALAGDYVVLSVSDTGTGMDAQIRANIFEPFFTTKEVGKGTGLGMSIVYGIIKQHHGSILVYSEPGRGTTFKIFLPLIQRAAEDIPARPSGLVAKGNETILIAEDEEVVLTLFRAVLEENGYRVLSASDGEEAIRVFADNIDSIDLVLLDTIMPKKNGRQAYEAMRARKPDLRALFMSGYTADIISRQGLLQSGFELLQKPLTPSDLLIHVRKVLDA